MQPQDACTASASAAVNCKRFDCIVCSSHSSVTSDIKKSSCLIHESSSVKIDPRELRRRLDSESARDCRLYQALNSLALSDSESDSDVDKKANITGAAHWGIKCDACLDAVVGTLWCCCSCIKYNLCDICYKNGKHDHDFYRISEPGGKRVRAVSRGSIDTFHICLDDLELSDSSEEYQSVDSDSEDESDCSTRSTETQYEDVLPNT